MSAKPIPICLTQWHVSYRFAPDGPLTYNVTTAISESEAIAEIRAGFSVPLFDASAYPMGSGNGEYVTIWDLETTDTFGGEANYCWVDRGLVCTPAVCDRPSLAIRRIRAAAGLTGTKARFEDSGYYLRWDQRNACIVTFATPRDT